MFWLWLLSIYVFCIFFVRYWIDARREKRQRQQELQRRTALLLQDRRMTQLMERLVRRRTQLYEQRIAAFRAAGFQSDKVNWLKEGF
jgi:hypothetical protein